MIKKIDASSRQFQDLGWLKTYWLFSFDNYFDPNNVSFGALRVFNDDKVAPGKGFDMHRHREMEIVSIILNGAISHEDSIGNRERIKAGEVQVMSAGSGIKHSEYNLEDKELHLYQIWFMPNKTDLKPSYDQKDYSKTDKSNKLLAVASGKNIDGALYISSDATMYLGNLEKGRSLEHKLSENDKCFIYVTSGKLSVNETEIGAGDQARIENESKLELSANDTTDFLFIDLH